MKNNFGRIAKLLFVLLLLIACSNTTYARYISHNKKNNFYNSFSIGGSLGYSNIFENYNQFTTPGSLGASLMFGYEFRLYSFWLYTGIEGQYLSANAFSNIDGTERKIIDTQGKPAVMHYEFGQFVEQQHYVFANVPIMLGYYSGLYGFYVGAGAKFGLQLYALEDASLRYTTSATYSQYVEDFIGMGQHDYSAYNVYAQANPQSPIKISAIAEIGYDVLTRQRQTLKTSHGLRVGLYVEYGLNNLVKSTAETPLYTIQQQNASAIDIVPFYSAYSTATHRINSFYAGIKMAYTFCVRTKNCTCDF